MYIHTDLLLTVDVTYSDDLELQTVTVNGKQIQPCNTLREIINEQIKRRHDADTAIRI